MAKRKEYRYDWDANQWKGAIQWRKWEKVGMRPSMDLDDLRLHWTERQRPDLLIKGAIVSLGISRSIESSTTITLEVADPQRKIFSVHLGRMKRTKRKHGKPGPVDEGWEPLSTPNVVGNPVEIILDDVVFRLVKVDHNWGTSVTTLTFEDRIIYWLRHKFGPRKISRSKVTRAEFILSQLREIKNEKVPFICPELHEVQPLARSQAKKRKSSVYEPGKQKGAGSGAFSGRVTVKGATANAQQKRNMDTAFDEANSIKGVGEDALALLAFCLIGETMVQNTPSDGILQVTPDTARGAGVDPMSIRQVVRRFMFKGYYSKSGIDAARTNVSMMEQAHSVQGFGVPYSGVTEAEARKWVSAWGGDPGGTSGNGRSGKRHGTYKKPFMFTRGKHESAWKCMQRYAQEVEWRLFTVGRAMYFMSEDDLFARRIRYMITPDTEALLDFGFSMDWGKKVSGATMRVNLDRWGGAPGSTVLLDGFGPPDGRWLITAVDRDWFSPEADVTLVQPVKPKIEPAAEVVSATYPAPATRSEETHPPWKGVHSVSAPFGQPRPTHIHAGADVGMPLGTPFYAPFNGTVTMITESGFGLDGGMLHVRSDHNIPHIINKGDKIGFGHQKGARVKVGQKVKPGQRLSQSNYSASPHCHFVLIKAGEGGNGTDGNHDPENFLRAVGGIR